MEKIGVDERRWNFEIWKVLTNRADIPKRFYNTFSCSWDEIYIEGFDGADDENLCKLKWGLNSKSEPFDNLVAEPAAETIPPAVVSTPAPVETSQTALVSQPADQIVPTLQATPVYEPITKAAPASEPVIKAPPASVPDSTPTPQTAYPPATVTTSPVISKQDLIVTTSLTASLSSLSAALPEVTLTSPQEAGAAMVDKA